jgi:hypothetical protein
LLRPRRVKGVLGGFCEQGINIVANSIKTANFVKKLLGINSWHNITKDHNILGGHPSTSYDYVATIISGGSARFPWGRMRRKARMDVLAGIHCI